LSEFSKFSEFSEFSELVHRRISRYIATGRRQLARPVGLSLAIHGNASIHLYLLWNLFNSVFCYVAHICAATYLLYLVARSTPSCPLSQFLSGVDMARGQISRHPSDQVSNQVQYTLYLDLSYSDRAACVVLILSLDPESPTSLRMMHYLKSKLEVVS